MTYQEKEKAVRDILQILNGLLHWEILGMLDEVEKQIKFSLTLVLPEAEQQHNKD